MNEWLHTLAMWGYRGVRTGALGREIAAELESVGFTVAQDLLLLSVDLSAGTASTAPTGAVRALRTWPRPGRQVVESLLDLDAASFGPVWRLDSDTFSEARSATAVSRVFTAESQGQIVGFLLAGATGRDGYIQRLAVHPDHRRAGHAGRLLDHAHRWLRRRGCSVAYVNTEQSNAGAVELYRRKGYAQLPYGLRVLERELTEGSRA